MQRPLIPRREQALGLTLIAAVIRHVEKQAAKQHGPKPEVALAAQARVVEQGPRALREFRQVLSQVGRQGPQGEQHGGDEQQHLQDIGDHHGPHPAQNVVGHGDAHKERQRRHVADPGDQGQHGRHAVHGDAGRDAAEKQKTPARNPAHRPPQALLQKGVNRYGAAAKHGGKQHRQPQHGQGHGQFVL